MTTPRRTATALAIAMLIGSGCAASRQRELERLSRRVESRLKSEQSQALASQLTDAERRQRLEHLTSLRYTLSAADIGLASVPRLVSEPQRPVAYDVLEEVYSTIEWNIPLGPGDALRGLPRGFSGGAFDFSALADPARATAPGSLPVITTPRNP